MSEANLTFDQKMDMLLAFDLRMPTPEENAERGKRWLDNMGPLLIERWPDKLAALSMPTEFVEFPQELADEFWNEDGAEWSDLARFVADKITSKIDFEPVFFKLNSRSPKDAIYPSDTCISWSGKHVLGVIRGSERCLEDCMSMRYAGVQPLICLRKYEPSIRPNCELRCFIKGGEIMAVAEYGRSPTLSYPKSFDSKLRASVDAYLMDVVGPCLPIDTVVVDIWIKNIFDTDAPKFGLIEINPFGLSDPVGALNYSAILSKIEGIARHASIEVK